MNGLENHFKNLKSNFKDVTVLGNFIDNHDNSRYLNWEHNLNRYKNSLVFILA